MISIDNKNSDLLLQMMKSKGAVNGLTVTKDSVDVIKQALKQHTKNMLSQLVKTTRTRH